MTESSPHPEPILSSLASDPDMQDLIRLFVDEMPTRIGALENAWNDGDLSTLERCAHQLKGASAGYGFGVIGQAAADLESTLHAERRELEDTRLGFERLVDLCRRAALGHTDTHAPDSRDAA